MHIERFINSPVSSNCYIITENKHSIIIDPGTYESKELIDKIKSLSLEIDYIILTHEHFDHCAGVNNLRLLYNNLQLSCSSKCNNAIQNSRTNYSAYWTEGKPFDIKPADTIIKNLDLWNWQGNEIRFYETPGHSIGSISFCINHQALFTGDCYIPNMRTYTNLNGGSKELLRQTLIHFYQLTRDNNKIIVYPGHLNVLPIEKVHFNEALRGFSQKQIEQEAK